MLLLITLNKSKRVIKNKNSMMIYNSKSLKSSEPSQTRIAPITEEINKIDEELKDLQKRLIDNDAEKLKKES